MNLDTSDDKITNLALSDILSCFVFYFLIVNEDKSIIAKHLFLPRYHCFYGF